MTIENAKKAKEIIEVIEEYEKCLAELKKMPKNKKSLRVICANHEFGADVHEIFRTKSQELTSVIVSALKEVFDGKINKLKKELERIE